MECDYFPRPKYAYYRFSSVQYRIEHILLIFAITRLRKARVHVAIVSAENKIKIEKLVDSLGIRSDNMLIFFQT